MDAVLHVLWVAFWGLLFLSGLVFIHEAGHYLVARAFGVRVTEFYLGLPSRFRLFYKSKKHGTEIGVTPLLLGGYNRICGMDAVPEGDIARAFAIVQREGRVRVEDLADEMGIDVGDAYPLMAGLVDLAAIKPYFNAELGEQPYQRDWPEAFETLARDRSLLTEYDAGHDFTSSETTLAGEPRPLKDPAAQLEIERSHTYQGLGYFKRVACILAGPIVNIIFAFLIVTGAYMSVEYQVGVNESVLGSVDSGSVAEAAGLQPGDAIIEVAGTKVKDWVGVSEALDTAKEAGEDFDIVYERDGRLQTARIDLPEGEKLDLIGVMAKTVPYHLTLSEAMEATMDYVSMVASIVVQLIMPQHTMEVLESSHSVVGISVMVADAVSSGFMDVLAVLAAVSMSLGFMNLLPIPPLDGGRILVETIGALMRRPLPAKILNALSYAGVAFFIFIFVVALKNDIAGIMAG